MLATRFGREVEAVAVRVKFPNSKIRDLFEVNKAQRWRLQQQLVHHLISYSIELQNVN